MMFKKLMMCSFAAIQLFFVESVSATLKLDDDFYVGKIPGKEFRGGKELWLVMERIQENNRSKWMDYLRDEKRKAHCRIYDERLSRLTHGSWFAYSVAEGRFLSNNEIWMAYVTNEKTPRKSFSSSNIEMFVTVTSSPNALLTTHLGIARSVEATKNLEAAKKEVAQTDEIKGILGTKGISVDLHSFAAKVMLERNPQRRYMVSPPVAAMRTIMVKALPGSVFVGTREMQNNLKNGIKPDYNRHIQTDGDDEAKNLEKFGQKCANVTCSDCFYDIMEKNPPILSVGLEGRVKAKCFDNTFTIFNHENPTKPWLIVDKSNLDYDWMFNHIYQPQNAETHYIVVDLQMLANSRKVESAQLSLEDVLPGYVLN